MIRTTKAQRAEQAALCFRLHSQGMTLMEISEQTGIAKTTVQDRIAEGIKLAPAVDIDQARQTQLERIQANLAYLLPKLKEGNPQAHNAAARWTMLEARLLGTLAPEKFEGSIDVNVHNVDEELASYASLLGLENDPTLKRVPSTRPRELPASTVVSGLGTGLPEPVDAELVEVKPPSKKKAPKKSSEKILSVEDLLGR